MSVAPAEVALEVGVNVLHIRTLLVPQQRVHAHHDARSAEATLAAMAGRHPLLYCMEATSSSPYALEVEVVRTLMKEMGITSTVVTARPCMETTGARQAFTLEVRRWGYGMETHLRCSTRPSGRWNLLTITVQAPHPGQSSVESHHTIISLLIMKNPH